MPCDNAPMTSGAGVFPSTDVIRRRPSEPYGHEHASLGNRSWLCKRRDSLTAVVSRSTLEKSSVRRYHGRVPLRKIVLYFGGFTTIYVTWLPCVVG
jgi:hypothetical protein